MGGLGPLMNGLYWRIGQNIYSCISRHSEGMKSSWTKGWFTGYFDSDCSSNSGMERIRRRGGGDGKIEDRWSEHGRILHAKTEVAHDGGGWGGWGGRTHGRVLTLINDETSSFHDLISNCSSALKAVFIRLLIS